MEHIANSLTFLRIWMRMHLFSLLLVLTQCREILPQKALLDSLLIPPYDKDNRPASEGETLFVNVTLNTLKLLYMDQTEETLLFTQEFLMSWTDEYLSFNSSEFSFPFEWIKVPEMSVWIPDIVFTNALSVDEFMDASQRAVDVKSDGTVRQSTPAVVATPCPLSISDFPFDVQHCDIMIGSWIHEIFEIAVQSSVDHILPSPEFEGNSEWELVSISVSNEVQLIKGDGEFSLLVYRLTLQRKPVYYVLVIQAPCLIVSTLSLFGVFTPFSQDYPRREKVTLGINMLLSISMMLTLVADMMPKAENLPLLGTYIISEIFLCAIAVIVQLITLVIHQRAETRSWTPPQWFCKFVLWDGGCRRKAPTIQETLPIPVPLTAKDLETDTSCDLLYRMNDITWNVKKTISHLGHFRDRCQLEEEWSLTWTRIFDRIDFLFLIIFQILNILVSVMYMR